MQTEELYRVYNKCKYDIGVVNVDGRQLTIKAGSFQPLTANDILYIESICTVNKFFSQKMLIAYDKDGNELNLEQLGLHRDEDAPVHLDDQSIEAKLKQSNKKIEEWLDTIEDPAELHGIYEVAKKMDLPASKIKILSEKMPNKDFIAD